MKRLRSLLGISIIMVYLLSCSVSQNSISSSQGFSQENIMKIREFMTTDEIKSLFGNPRRVESETFGTRTKNPWQALIWYYDNKYYSTKKFVFAQYGDQLILQNWEVK